MTSHHVARPTTESPANHSPTRRVWALSKTDRVVECEITEHVAGHEVRVYLGGELYYQRLDTSRAAAEAQATNLMRVLLADGWLHRCDGGVTRLR